MKNLKLCFFFLLLPFLVFPSFFLLSPFSQSSFSTSSPKISHTYPSDTWTSKEKQQTLLALSKDINTTNWLFVVAFGLKKLEFKSGGKDVVFYFDKLASAFQEQIFKQKKMPTPEGFDFTKIQGEAQKQLLQPYKRGTTNYVNSFETAYWPMLIKHADSFLDFIRPSLLKMSVLGLSKVGVSFKSQFNINPILTKNTSYKDLNVNQDTLIYLALLTFSPIPNFAKTVLDRSINKVWTIWLQTLQKASGLGLTYLTVGKEKVDVSSLVKSSQKEVSSLPLNQLQTLKKLEPLTLSKLQTQVQIWIYKTNIQSVLENFATSKITQIKINGTTYQIDLLLKKTNLQLSGPQLPPNAKNQLLSLVKAKITFQTLEDALLLETYFLTIKDNLNALRNKNVTQVTINGKTYSLVELSKPINKNKTVALLSVDAKTELAILAKNAITKTQLDTALTTILATKVAEEAILPVKKKSTKNKDLTIGLSVGGGVLFLSALGGFLYWFFKIKK